VKLRSAIVLLILSVSIASLLAGISSAGTDHCREGRQRVADLSANGVPCSTARSVARRYDDDRAEAGTFPGERQTIGRFRCHTRRVGTETYRVRCVRDADEIVRFEWGL
jgi:hypothetical protein